MADDEQIPDRMIKLLQAIVASDKSSGRAATGSGKNLVLHEDALAVLHQVAEAEINKTASELAQQCSILPRRMKVIVDTLVHEQLIMLSGLAAGDESTRRLALTDRARDYLLEHPARDEERVTSFSMRGRG